MKNPELMMAGTVQDSPVFVASLDLKGEQSLQRVHRLGLFPSEMVERGRCLIKMSCTLASHSFCHVSYKLYPWCGRSVWPRQNQLE